MKILLDTHIFLRFISGIPSFRQMFGTQFVIQAMRFI